LLLRLAVVLRDRFKLELHAHRELFTDLGVSLTRTSFLSLWGKSLALYGGAKWATIDSHDEGMVVDDCIVLRLDPHLLQLSDSFSFTQPTGVGQFQLFPAVGVVADIAANSSTGHRRHG
jgi:hypothetical protein